MSKEENIKVEESTEQTTEIVEETKEVKDTVAEEVKDDSIDEKKSTTSTSEKHKEALKKKAEVSKPRVKKRSKRYQEIAKAIKDTKKTELTISEAISIFKNNNKTKFDPSLEVHFKLGIDVKQADQMVRGTLILPNGSGKTNIVYAIVDEANIDTAKAAGATKVNAEVIEDLEKGLIEFNTLIAHPTEMSKLGKYAKILGPRGLMPSPKAGTVTDKIEETIKNSLGGQVEYRADNYGIVHLAIGKLSFTEKDLNENAELVYKTILQAKPKSSKGIYMQSVYITSSMSPSIRVSATS